MLTNLATISAAALVAAVLSDKQQSELVDPWPLGMCNMICKLLLADNCTVSAAIPPCLQAAAAKHVAGGAAIQQYLHNSDTLYTYKDPVSPHLAAAEEGRVIADDTIVTAVAQQLQHFTAAVDAKKQQQQVGSSSSRVQGLSVVETAGGVTSPGSSGTLQVCADILCGKSMS